MTLKHSYTNPIADDPASALANETLPSHWNADHVLDSSDTQVLFNDGGTVGGDAGFTYDKTVNVLSLNGSANTLALVGSATTVAPSITVTGNDTDISVKVGSKGLGFVQLGPDTAGILARDIDVEVYGTATQHATSAGIYIEKYAGDIASSSLKGVFSVAGGGGATQDSSGLIGVHGWAYSYTPTGRTIGSVTGIYAQASHDRAGSCGALNGLYCNIGGGGSSGPVTSASLLTGTITSGAGGITDAYGLHVVNYTGTITTAYGVKVDNLTAAGTNYSCHFGAGLYHFDALTASQFVTTSSSKNLVSTSGTSATALLDAFTGDSGAGGVKGLVPAPAAGDAAAGKFLKANGAWTAVSATLGNPYSQDSGSSAAIYFEYTQNSPSIGRWGVENGTGGGTIFTGSATNAVVFGSVTNSPVEFYQNDTKRLTVGAASVFTGTVAASNLSGSNTGDQTNITGNAATVTVADAGGDTSTWVLLGTGQTGSLAPATDAGLTYNATTNALTATTFIGALTGAASDNLPLAGGTMSGAITLGESTSIALDPAGSADGKYTGITVAGTGGATIAVGDLVTLDKDDSRWELVDISVAAAATGDARGILGLAVTTSSDGAALTVLLNGILRSTSFPTLTIGAAVFASTTGDVVVAQPTTTDHVIRIVGYGLTAGEMYFNPGRGLDDAYLMPCKLCIRIQPNGWVGE